MKLVHKDHPRDQQNVVLIHRWSLNVGSMAWKIYTRGPLKCGLYKQVVFIYRWSFRAGYTILQANVSITLRCHTTEYVSGLEFDLLRSLKVKFDGAIGLPI